MHYFESDLVIKGINIHYYRTGGNKPPLVLIHGATDNALCWGPVAEWLAEKFDILMADAQGHGLSDRLNESFVQVDHAHQTVALIRHLKMQEPVILGHSMGAVTASNIAALYPDLPKAVILEDPAWRMPPPPGQPEPENKQQQEINDFIAGFARQTYATLLAEVRANNPKWSESDLQAVARAKLQFDPRLFIFDTVNHYAYIEQVPQYKKPVLLIIAESGVVSLATAQHAAGLAKSPFNYVLIKDSGHSIHRENFKDYKAAVENFLKSL